MANIRTYEAPEFHIQPSEAGPATLARAATEEARMGTQAGRDLQQVGADIGRGLNQVGGAVNQYEERAQQHTDSLAEVDFQNSLTNTEIAAKGGVNQAGTPTDENGQPIENTPGRGGDKSLPPTASVPSPGQFSKVASDAIEAHQQMGQDAIDRARENGVSQKTLDRMTQQLTVSNNRLQVHSAVVAGEVAATHLVHTTEQSVNTITAGIDRDPSQLDAGLQQIHETIGAAQGSMTGDFAKQGAKTFEAAEQKARTDAITASISSLARNGQVGKANAILDSDKYNKDFTGQQREALKTHIVSLANQGAEDDARKQAAQQRKEFSTMDQQMGQAIANYKPGTPMPDFRGDPTWQKHPEKGAQLEAVYRAHEEATLHQNQPDPTISYQNGQKLQKQLFDPTSNPDAVMDQARTALTSKDPNARINAKDYAEIQKLYSDPNARSLGKSVNDWLTKGGEGRIDPNLGAGPLSGGRSLLGQQQVQAWKTEFDQRAKADPAHAHDLLDPTKAGNMVSNEALAPYRVTEAMKAKFDAQKATLDEQADKTQNPGGVPGSGGGIMGTIRSGINGDWFSSGAPTNGSAVAPIPGGLQATQPAATPAAPAQVKTVDDVQKLAPGAKFVIPEGPHKGQIGTVPQKMNYAPNEQTTPAQDAITNALAPGKGAPGKGDFGGPAGGTPQQINYTPNPESQAPAHAASVRTNNPGAQWPNRLATEFGATGHENLKDGNKIAVFPTPIHGAAANMALMEHKYVGMTIGSVQQTWSGQHRSTLPGYASSERVTPEMMHDPKFVIPFMKAMAEAEAPHGSSVMSDAQWQQAFEMYESKTGTKVASR